MSRGRRRLAAWQACWKHGSQGREKLLYVASEERGSNPGAAGKSQEGVLRDSAQPGPAHVPAVSPAPPGAGPALRPAPPTPGLHLPRTCAPRARSCPLPRVSRRRPGREFQNQTPEPAAFSFERSDLRARESERRARASRGRAEAHEERTESLQPAPGRPAGSRSRGPNPRPRPQPRVPRSTGCATQAPLPSSSQHTRPAGTPFVPLIRERGLSASRSAPSRAWGAQWAFNRCAPREGLPRRRLGQSRLNRRLPEAFADRTDAAHRTCAGVKSGPWKAATEEPDFGPRTRPPAPATPAWNAPLPVGSAYRGSRPPGPRPR